MARNRSERMPQPPAGWSDACIRTAHLYGEELTEYYDRREAGEIARHGWRGRGYPAYLATPRGDSEYLKLSDDDVRSWIRDIRATRVYVAAAFWEAHGKKQK